MLKSVYEGMVDYIEGVGGEVLLCTLLSMTTIALLLFLAWTSTRVRPLWTADTMWLVQMTATSPTRNVLELTQIDQQAVERLTSEGGTRIVRVTAANQATATANSVPANSQNTAPVDHTSIDAQLNPLTPVDAQTLAEVMQSSGDLFDTPTEEPVSGPQITTAPATASDTVSPTSASSITPDGGDVNIRLKFVDDTHRSVKSWLTATVAEFKRAHFESEVADGKCVRLIFGGQLLRDDSRSLASYGIADESTVHCHVSRAHYQHANGAAEPAAVNRPPPPLGHELVIGGMRINVRQATAGVGVRFELGSYMHVIFAAKFAMLWFFFAMYPQYFDFPSFFSLILCTGVYAAFVGVNFRRNGGEQATARNAQTTNALTTDATPTNAPTTEPMSTNAQTTEATPSPTNAQTTEATTSSATEATDPAAAATSTTATASETPAEPATIPG